LYNNLDFRHTFLSCIHNVLYYAHNIMI